MTQRFPYAKTFLLGFGFFGISLIWPIFNNFIPIFLRDNFKLSATLIGFIMTWDNYLNMYYLASNITAVAGPQSAGFLIDLTGGNYRIMFIFGAIFMALAGILMLRVAEQRRDEASVPAVQAGTN